MGGQSPEVKAVRQFVTGISTLHAFHPSVFAYLFAAESSALQQRALDIFLSLVNVWADQDTEDASDQMVNVIITARRIRDGLKIYQP